MAASTKAHTSQLRPTLASSTFQKGLGGSHLLSTSLMNELLPLHQALGRDGSENYAQTMHWKLRVFLTVKEYGNGQVVLFGVLGAMPTTHVVTE